MSINNVNNMNKTDLIKLALLNKGKGTQATQKPSWMLPTGSIFFTGKNTQPTPTAPTLSDLNVEKSIFESANKPKAKEGTDGKPEKDDIKNIDNAADGKKAAADAENQQEDIKAKTAQTQQDQKEVEKDNKDAVKLDTKIKKEQKTFETKMKKNEKIIEENNLAIQKSAEGIDETQIEIESMQNELSTLMASEGDQNQESIYAQRKGGSGNSSKIEDLQKRIGAKTTIMDVYGKQIYTLQRSSSKTIKSMASMSNVQIKNNKINQANLKVKETGAQKVIKVADKIDQISALVSQVGQTVNYAGKGLIALGAAMTWAAGTGAALIATGKVMQKVGTVTELAGNYGQAAANITKTAAYAADGNLMGAISSAGAAMMSGASAAKSTKNLGKSMDAINKQGEKATQKLAAGVAAKEAVKNETAGMTKDEAKKQLGGMSKKQARSAIKNDLMNDMSKTKGLEGKSWKELKNNLTEGDNSFAKQSLSDSKGLFAQTSQTTTANLKKAGKKVTNKKINKAFNNKIAGTVGKETTKAGKSSTINNIEKMGKSLQTAAAQLTPQTQPAGIAKKGPVRPPRYNAKTQQIIANNEKQRAARNRRYVA